VSKEILVRVLFLFLTSVTKTYQKLNVKNEIDHFFGLYFTRKENILKVFV